MIIPIKNISNIKSVQLSQGEAIVVQTSNGKEIEIVCNLNDNPQLLFPEGYQKSNLRKMIKQLLSAIFFNCPAVEIFPWESRKTKTYGNNENLKVYYGSPGLKEGMVKKGGINEPPTIPRPEPPKGQCPSWKTIEDVNGMPVLGMHN